MLSEDARKEIAGMQRKYVTKRSLVMPALMVAQREKGHLIKEDMEEIAQILDIQPVVVNEVGKFYTMYNVEKPVGRYHVQVCRNLSCSLVDAERMIAHIEKKLSIKTGETTHDDKFTLNTVECLGSCGTAPMMQINDDYYESLTEMKIDEILDGLE